MSKIIESKSLSSKIESKVPGRSPFPVTSPFKWILKLDHCNWNGTHQGTIEFAVKTESQARQWREKFLVTIQHAKKPDESSTAHLRSGYEEYRPDSYSTEPSGEPTGPILGGKRMNPWLSMGVYDGIRVSIDDFATKILVESKLQSDDTYLLIVLGTFIVTFCTASVAEMSFVWSMISAVMVTAPTLWTFLRSMNRAQVSRTTTLKVSQVIEASPFEVLSFILQRGDVPISGGGFLRDIRRVQKIDKYTDVMQLVLPPVQIGFYTLKPRDLCLMRYWRKEDDGSYLIVMSSTEHASCPETKQFVRAHVDSFAIHIGVPLSDGDADCKSCKKRSLCALYVRYDPECWKSYFAQYGNVAMRFCMGLLRMIVHIRDEVHELSFTSDASWFSSVPSDGTHTTIQSKKTLAEGGEEIERKHPDSAVMPAKLIPCSLHRSMWAEPSPSSFRVRGPTYLEDGKKVKATASPFRLVGMDMLSFTDYLTCFNVCADSSNIIHRMNEKEQVDSEVPYTFAVNFVLPGRENICIVCYFQPSEKDWRDDPKYSKFMESFLDFVDGDDDYRNARFKIIPFLAEGGLILKKTLGSQFLQKPTLPGKKGVKMHHHRGENYFEVDIDIGSEPHARDVTKLLKESLRNVVIDVAILFEAQEVDELPEMILGTARLSKANLANAKRMVVDDNLPESIRDLMIRDRVSGKRVMANSRSPIPFETEMFVGNVIFKFNTDPVDPVYAPYFEGKKRMFEIQVQGRFKSKTDASLCLLGLEGTYHLELGMFGKGLVHVLTKFVFAITPGAQAHMGDKHSSNEPCLNPWMLCMPLAGTVDRFIETPPGKQPPKVGVDMLPEVTTKAEWQKIKEYSPENIYSISMHGMYVDFVRWLAVGIPGVGQIDLRKLLGVQPLRIVAFATPPGHIGALTQNDKKYLFDFELNPPGE